MENNENTAIIKIHCPDQKGIVARVTDFINLHHGNIISVDQHVDHEDNLFSMRVSWDLRGFNMPREEIRPTFQKFLGDPYQMKWTLNFTDEVPRMAIFVSKASHCLYDLLARYQSGEFKVKIPVVIGNHNILEPVARQFGIDFVHIPITAETKAEQEKKEIEILQSYKIDFVVLARYMQVLSQDFINHYPEKVINIHHSFLPAFAGARPYHAAHKRGVKIIGATSHYVTSDLDAGPIIEQDIARISHHDSVKDLIQKGKDVEKIVLSRAVKAHIERKTLVYKNRTIIFN
ncbi:formyltetrahydrofolate deformylase [Saccharicrinis carchari]|uniref:Formyltetrahydrofolate deformylase n=1 Tax=Saccharicrinis carchari TaxID=1168039 RepID=A0A521DH24_SACCC|nr:formyltetrahydrofolate deformylase [Saccharicrinis carchari]SMO71017.1 formyltetrahydrofolate deformylase [Saccharicrinis carchari]